VPDLETIRFAVEGHVGWLRLSRPERLNAFIPRMWREIRTLGRDLLADPSRVRALVVLGEGRAFSSGIDTEMFAAGLDLDAFRGEGDAPRHEDPAVDTVLHAQDAFTWLEDAPFATIAAIRGFALGAGLQLAMACDLRIAARGTKLGLLELRYGMMPDLGGTQRLPRLVGPGKAKELVFTAGQIDADDALRIGLVEQVVSDEELEEAAGSLAVHIAAQPPLAIAGAKRAIAVAVSGASLTDGLLAEAENQAVCLRSDDAREAMAAFAQKRPPAYQGR
jgi:enoyl-CoA hydratase/carnithine racemase